MRPLVACAALVVLAGCGFPSIGGADQDEIDDAAAQTCAEVRSGIAAFNERKYTATIDHFVKAKPFAKRYAELSDEKKADDLLEAVEYYANLPADEYREAFASSRQFQKYKEITLGQCETGTSA
ncbi:hypothetical protein [Aeromicrobium sp.]|uniref:hypothetical protein n=1 Tax=Aeromicrobium sp. TaxID=1871063 RepID=UPI003D6BB8E8